MDDQRQAGFLRGLDMQAQRGFLHLGALGGVVIVEPGFTDAHEFRMLSQRHQLVHRGHWFFGHAHRVGACGVEDAAMRLGDGTHGGLVLQLGADRHHPRHSGGVRAGDDVVALTVEIGEIEMAMAVCDLGREGQNRLLSRRIRRRRL